MLQRRIHAENASFRDKYMRIMLFMFQKHMVREHVPEVSACEDACFRVQDMLSIHVPEVSTCLRMHVPKGENILRMHVPEVSTC